MNNVSGPPNSTGSQGKATVIQSSIEPFSGLEDLSGCFPKGLVTNFGWCYNFEFDGHVAFSQILPPRLAK